MVLLSGAQFGDDSSLAHQFQLVAMDVEAVDGPQNREETVFQFHQFRWSGHPGAYQCAHGDTLTDQCVGTTHAVDAAEDRN